jgi:hypothetical protein
MYVNWQRIPLLISDYMNGHSLSRHFRMLYHQKKWQYKISESQQQGTVEICVVCLKKPQQTKEML